jgi:hypothetical protein
VQHKENSEFWNPTCVIGGNKNNCEQNAKSGSRAFRGPKAGKSACFTHPDFSAAKLQTKSAQITRVNTVVVTDVFSTELEMRLSFIKTSEPPLGTALCQVVHSVQ